MSIQGVLVVYVFRFVTLVQVLDKPQAKETKDLKKSNICQ
jgi:hypothetical protein